MFIKALLLHEIIHISFSLTGGTETEIVNAQVSDKAWYLTSWNNTNSVLSHLCVVPCHL